MNKGRRWIPGFEGLYSVEREGAVFKRDDRQMKPRIDRYGYANVRLSRDGKKSWKKAHRVVCEAFHGAPPTATHHAAHLDNDPLNNHCENLAWLTPKENNAHKLIFGTHQDMAGEKHPCARLSDDDVAAIRERASAGESGRALGREYGVNQSHISRIVRGRRRKASPNCDHPNIAIGIGSTVCGKCGQDLN